MKKGPLTIRPNPTRAKAAAGMLASIPTVKSEPVLWWVLITEAEMLSARHGLGLANVWAAIHRSDYAEARRILDKLMDDHWPVGRDA